MKKLTRKQLRRLFRQNRQLFRSVLQHEQSPAGVFSLKPYVLESLPKYQAIDRTAQPLYYPSHTLALSIPIAECHDPLVEIAPYVAARHSQIQCCAGAAEFGAQSERMFLRKGVCDRLLQAEKHLRTLTGRNLTFRVTDAFRPLSLQRQYFDQALRELKHHEHLRGHALYERATEIISDPACNPPHATGGALDLTIVDLETGAELDMGTRIDDLQNPAIYTWHPAITALAKQNRALLYTVLTAEGFSNVTVEWWHFSLGDQECALRLGQKKAKYGLIDQL